MNDPLWFKDAVIYEVPIKSFQDSNGDGFGDIRGLIQRLDYLADLGITAIWILPFYPSPQRDDGYDISDYYAVNPKFGTIDDVRELLDEAHKRGMKVITELVINHTSDQCEWFQRARRAPKGSPERDFYVWSDDPAKYKEVRIIFQDFETSNWTWDPVAQAYYWHRFYSHQPDLNFDNPLVREEVLKVFEYWLEMGVDGVRLDAIPYLYERDGTNGENLSETHEFLRMLREQMDQKFPGRMMLAEANQWPEDSVAYFGDGDECHMAFHFPLMPRMFMSLQMEDRFPITDILDQTPAIPSCCQWALFLRNHDELTLEMVTDEERDYMYRVYAKDPHARLNLGIRRRLAPLLGNNRRKIELINSLLFSMPGTPIIYYGDEIGMGDNIYLGDRNGVRTPMQWNADRNAGFSKCNPQKLYLPTIIDPEYHYESVNVDNQQGNLSSLFWWMRRLLRVRAQSSAFARGDITFLQPANAKILAFVRKYEQEIVLVVANLSRFAQHVDLNLIEYAGLIPEEMFGHHQWPPIGEQPMSVMLGPHGFYWFKLQSANVFPAGAHAWSAPTLKTDPKWEATLLHELENKVLPAYLPTCRWFGGKGRRIRDINTVYELEVSTSQIRLLMIEVLFVEGLAERYLLPLAIISTDEARNLSAGGSFQHIASFADGQLLCDAFYLSEFRCELFRMMAEGKNLPGKDGLRLIGTSSTSLDEDAINAALKHSRVVSLEQSNTSVIYADLFFMKFFRKYETGIHPDQEITSVLGEEGDFSHVPEYVGALKLMELDGNGAASMMCRYMPHQGPGWTFVLDQVAIFIDQVLQARQEIDLAKLEDLIEPHFPSRIEQLGTITAEMHLTLAKAGETRRDFAAEPFSMHYQRSLYQGMRTSASKVFRQITSQLDTLDDQLRPLAEALLAAKEQVFNQLSQICAKPIETSKIRIHGDYHLGQVLNTGNDFVVIDFEGEPSLSLGERRLKRSVMKDLAGMLRSFHYAAATQLKNEVADDYNLLEPWLEDWAKWCDQLFLRTYYQRVGETSFLPPNEADRQTLLDIFMLDKALYEIGYELSYRPDWVAIPLRAVISMLNLKPTSEKSSTATDIT